MPLKTSGHTALRHLWPPASPMQATVRLSLAPTGLRCGLPRRVGQRSQWASKVVVRAQGTEQGPAVAEQQQAAAAVPPAQAAAQQQEEVYDEAAVAVNDISADPSSMAEEQQAWQAVAPPPPPADPRGRGFSIDLQHPGVKVAGGLCGGRLCLAPVQYVPRATAKQGLNAASSTAPAHDRRPHAAEQ